MRSITGETSRSMPTEVPQPQKPVQDILLSTWHKLMYVWDDNGLIIFGRNDKPEPRAYKYAWFNLSGKKRHTDTTFTRRRGLDLGEFRRFVGFMIQYGVAIEVPVKTLDRWHAEDEELAYRRQVKEEMEARRRQREE